MKNKLSISGIACHIFLYVIAAAMFIPFVWLIISSFRPNLDIFKEPFAIPKTLNFDNYIAVLESQPMFKYLFNTVFVAFFATFLNIVISSMASFVLLFDFKLKSKISALFYIGSFIPTNAFMVPYYIMINKMGLYDNLWGLVIVYAVINLPLSIMIVRGYMTSLPMELMDSARIDGATIHQTFLQIIMPLTKPGIVTACVFIVLNSWNELLFGNLLNQSEKSRTVQVAIKSFLSTFSADYGHAFAAMIICILPTIIIYVFLTDKIIGGMTAGAVKG